MAYWFMGILAGLAGLVGLVMASGARDLGISFFGRAFSEPVLIEIAYAYEQATHHRRAPESTPPLR